MLTELISNIYSLPHSNYVNMYVPVEDGQVRSENAECVLFICHLQLLELDCVCMYLADGRAL